MAPGCIANSLLDRSRWVAYPPHGDISLAPPARGADPRVRRERDELGPLGLGQAAAGHRAEPGGRLRRGGRPERVVEQQHGRAAGRVRVLSWPRMSAPPELSDRLGALTLRDEHRLRRRAQRGTPPDRLAAEVEKAE